MTTPPTVTLPEGMRLLSHEQMRAVHDAVREAARRVGVPGHKADEISYSALAAAGQFVQPPDPEPDTCTALYLPHQAAAVTADILGVWQQCGDDPGHGGDDHDSGDFGWSDSDTGALPAHTADEEKA
ncbi:hypothetical protein [Streptomyces alboflavus]|uniref:hypothetical protein n=1 Tax=Streptomyces alboflavus TaxID=67267 RepID=UPI000F657D05|nr:hypothetical protein [Streptomyces alboflavus]